jgi:hypothetical protein
MKMGKDLLTVIAAIESRVARIKARVAELTGNMDNGAPAGTPARRY